MDEENKKINISSFFERLESVEGVANNALSKSNANFSAINNLQVLIQNISMSINEIKTDIREIANYIVVEKKLEMDQQLDEKFEAQDEKQKKEMLDRAKALGQPAPTSPQRQEEPVTAQKGGFLSGLLKAIAIGGIVALAAPLVPVIAPLILGALKVAIIGLIVGVVGKKLIEFGAKIGGKIKEGYEASLKAVANLKENISEKINVLKSSIGDFLSEKKKQFLNLAGKAVNFGKEKIGQVKDITDKLKNEVVDKGSKFVEGAKDKLKNVAGDAKERGVKGIIGGVADTFTGGVFDFDKKGDSKIQEGQQKLFEKGKETISNTAEKVKNRVGDAFEKGKDAVFNIGNAITDDEGKPKGIFRGLAGALDFATGGRFDLDKRGSSVTDEASPLGQVIKAVSPPKIDSSSFAPAKGPNTSQVVIRSTSPSIPFIKTVKNQYLSTNPGTNKLPPEIARLIQ